MLTMDASRHREADASFWGQINHTIVVLASASAGLFFVLLMAAFVITGDAAFLARSAAPVAVGGSGAIMLATNRPHPVIQIAIGGIGLIVFASVGESAVPGNPSIGILIMGVMAVALAQHHVVGLSLVTGAVLGATGYAWHPVGTSSHDRMSTALHLVVAFVLISWLLNYLKSQASADRARLQELLASKDQFLATLSHELRTPLTSVVALAQEMDQRWAGFSTDEIAELTSLLVAESSDMADLVEDLLMAARADAEDITLARRVLDLHDEIAAVVSVHSGVEMDRPSAGSAYVVADPLRLRQIVRNLISNALRYGGSRVHVATASDGLTASVVVKDNGPPLPSTERERIFDAYHRAGGVEGKPGSVGLGLTVSRRLARLMGGDLVYDHDGSEACFRLTFPQVSRPVTVTPGEAVGV